MGAYKKRERIFGKKETDKAKFFISIGAVKPGKPASFDLTDVSNKGRYGIIRWMFNSNFSCFRNLLDKSFSHGQESQ